MSTKLPDFLFSGWRFRPRDIAEAKARGDLDGWTVSSLSIAYLQYQLDRYDEEFQSNVQDGPPSLASLSVQRLVETLRSSVNLQEDVEAVSESLDYWTQEPGIPYLVLRLLDMSRKTTIKGSKGNRKIIDIDEAVLAGERCIRSGRHKFVQSYLVTLKDLAAIVGPPDNTGLITIKSKSPPKGSFEFLDYKRKPVVQIQGTDASFTRTFDRVTRNILKGLNWDHVFIQGGMVLNTLLHTDSSKDNEGDIAECDIDLYLYDLTPEEANRKVEHIYKVYAANMGPKSKHIVMKTAKTITFIPRYPERRMQVVLKLQHSPLESMLRIDLDACAIAYDGSQVFMLPRCARALETGYNVFTMDLIWGHRLGSRRETQSYRVFKYAGRGFGLRILPSYLRSVESKGLSDAVMSDEEKCPTNGDSACTGLTRIYKDEPGLKTIRRIARLAQNFVYRWHFGPSKGMGNNENKPRNLISLPPLYHTYMDTRIPGSNNSIGVFEHFMRDCVAWRLVASGLAYSDEEEAFLEKLGYDFLEIYDSLPTYKWDARSTENMEKFKDNANYYNRYLFMTLQKALREKLHVDLRLADLARHGGYLTRRVRRLIAGDDIGSVQVWGLTMPLILPTPLETYFSEILNRRYVELPNNALSTILIPVHDPSKYNPAGLALPSLQDTLSESGNIRYWLITNEGMWAGQHRALDEVAELLLMLFCWFTRARPDWFTPRLLWYPKFDTDDPRCIWFIAEYFRRRLILPRTSDTLQKDETLSEREARLFRAWALTNPPRYETEDRNYFDETIEQVEDELERGADKHDKDVWQVEDEDESQRERDVDDKLFGQDGDEGTWDCEEGVPMWRQFDDIFDLRNLSI